MAKIQKRRGDCIRYSLHISRAVGKLPIVVETSNFKTPTPVSIQSSLPSFCMKTAKQHEAVGGSRFCSLYYI